ncbi:sensor histidine kinase [Polynucleobacter arcticus]|uniref:histidine kinase n=1 Tax=Polynucleobacter arcticus TaxID=1743165 RepID=A0A6M9PEA5_9BURK|nr:HAMP domain-containing sensor histidine kinase [Polynucleobacter arcticus]QKM60344.1 sensor histidine kinase [Polynucleobacter arcticus]
MKLLLSLYFFVLATIQLGLFIGVYHYYRSQITVRPSPYWMGSLIVSVFALTTFGAGIITLEDVSKPEFNFTVANTLFYIAAILQLLFCRSLNKPVSKRVQYVFLLSALIFGLVFEWMRIHSTFESRTSLICLVTGFFFILQIVQLRIKRATAPSKQLIYLQYATSAELFFAIGRLSLVLASGLTIREVEQIPQLLILLTITQIVMNTLAYIAIGAYWSERIARSNVQSQIENEEIKSLLMERENLISNLLKANKTAATGALSASIAHELNQPLGASQLNIQFLQKKLLEGNLTVEQNQEILAALLADNQRAASIIQSLRSIFSSGKIGLRSVEIGGLIESVLEITTPEIQAKNIQVVLKLSSTALVNANQSEMEQVFLNLMNNAIQALVASNKVPRILQIESHDFPGGLELRVTDNGLGIPAEIRLHLFELLAGSDKKSSMGLGLWLCRHIVRRHGGRIDYQDAPGGGAQFIVFLPKASL